MGTSPIADVASRIRLFASSRAWVEGAAVRQLEQVAGRPDVVSVVGLPDLHPGHHGPVGCAVLAEGRVFPDVIGTDIGCGMQFHVLDLPERKLRLDKAVERLAALEGTWDGDAAGLMEERDMPVTGFVSSLGTIGGGNHFCELQGVEEIVDAEMARAIGLERGGLGLLVHSGSRGLGAAIFAEFDRGGTDGLRLEEGGEAYLLEHNGAVRFARLNREVIAMRATEALRVDCRFVLDNPHNIAQPYGKNVLHRKGAAPADRGLVPVPGSRGAVTYLVKATDGARESLLSLAHGAGRKHDRGSMQNRLGTQASTLTRLARNPFGGHVVCHDRKLLLEEAPEAYKDVERVVAEMEEAGLCRVVAIMRPLVTFKTTRGSRDGTRRTVREGRR